MYCSLFYEVFLTMVRCIVVRLVFWEWVRVSLVCIVGVMDISLGSSVTHNICGCMFMGSGLLFICRCRFVLYSAKSGVNSVHVVSSGLSMILLFFVNVCMCCTYGCMYALAFFYGMCRYFGNVICV